MNFAEQPPSKQWLALKVRGVKFAEVWFKPDEEPWGLRFRIPQNSFHVPLVAKRLTLETLLKAVGLAEPPEAYVMVHCDGAYTTNIPVEDLVDGKGMIATRYEGSPIPPVHGGPARLLVPHLYFWKSAKWVRRLRFIEQDEPGFWESLGYHIYGNPWKEQRYDGD